MSCHKPAEAGKADWEIIPIMERDAAQSWAELSHGIVAPSPLLSVAGAAVSLSGIIDLGRGKYVPGAVKVAVGFGMDCAGGVISEMTKTRSPLGAEINHLSRQVAVGGIIGAGIYRLLHK